MKKFLAIFLALVLTLGLATVAFASGEDNPPAEEEAKVTITIERDSSYTGNGDGESAGRAYTWYEIFRASYSANESTGGGVNAGVPGDITASGDGFSYYLLAEKDAAIIAKLGSWNATDKKWEPVEANKWFTLTPSADGSRYIVTWTAADSNAATVQAAAAWLVENGVYVATGSMSFADGKWTAEVDKGYYVIKGDTGANLIAATTNINIKEKNSYPPIDKTQQDEDGTALVDSETNVAVGDVINYQVKVSVPADAQGNITVYDTMSAGLTYNKDLKITVDGVVLATTEYEVVEYKDWKIVLKTANLQGKDVIFTYSGTVNENALVDTGKENTAKLEYGDNYKSEPETVKFKTYYTGIEKVDGKNKEKKLVGVKFLLKEGDNLFPVAKNADGYYVPVTIEKGEMTDEQYAAAIEAAATVETDANGKIIIRGLDKDKTYTLTEIETNDGYNLLDAPKTLTLVEDGYTTEAPVEGEEGEPKPTFDPTTQFDQVENNKGTVLPSTGGIGTTIFYVVGGILVAAAGILLITKKRMSKEQ